MHPRAIRPTFTALLALALTCLASASASAQAFCALRDPVRHIQDLHGRPIRCRSLVAPIDEQVRRAVAARLPFTLHARELGRHTLYVLTDEGRPGGYMHARSEASPWGMVEVVWSLSEQLTVREFRFQRCRSPQRRYFETETFRDWFRGKDYASLLAMLDEDGGELTAEHQRAFAGRERMLGTIVRSALKAILVTDVAWGGEIAERRLQAMLAEVGPAVSFEARQRAGGVLVVVGRDADGAEVGRAVRVPDGDQARAPGALFTFSAGGQERAAWRLARPMRAAAAAAAAPMGEGRTVAPDPLRDLARQLGFDDAR
ncbi:MAG: hypothetical protein KAI24_10415 [Planctomycetes bacterium]|nr:hypothetical protein [Planctomycetota bacterium]